MTVPRGATLCPVSTRMPFAVASPAPLYKSARPSPPGRYQPGGSVSVLGLPPATGVCVMLVAVCDMSRYRPSAERNTVCPGPAVAIFPVARSRYLTNCDQCPTLGTKEPAGSTQ